MGEWHQLFAGIYDSIFVKWKYLYLWLVAVCFRLHEYINTDIILLRLVHKMRVDSYAS